MTGEKTLRDVLKEEIFNERTQRYKRNVLVLFFIILLVQLGGDYIDFSQLKVFGIGPNKNKITDKNEARCIVLLFLWAFALYNLVYFVYLAYWNSYVWYNDLFSFRSKVTQHGRPIRTYFPLLEMYYKEEINNHPLPRGDKDTIGYITQNNITYTYNYEKKDDQVLWTLTISSDYQKMGNVTYAVSIEDINNFKAKRLLYKIELFFVFSIVAGSILIQVFHY